MTTQDLTSFESFLTKTPINYYLLLDNNFLIYFELYKTIILNNRKITTDLYVLSTLEHIAEKYNIDEEQVFNFLGLIAKFTSDITSNLYNTRQDRFKVIEQNLEKLEEFSNEITAADYNDKGLFFIKYYTDQFIKFTLHAQTCLQNLESQNIDFILSMNKPSKYHIDQKIFLDGNKIFNSGLPSEHIITEQIIPCTIFDILLAGQETYIVNIGNQLGTQFFLPVNEIPDQDKFSALNMIFNNKK